MRSILSGLVEGAGQGRGESCQTTSAIGNRRQIAVLVSLRTPADAALEPLSTRSARQRSARQRSRGQASAKAACPDCSHLLQLPVRPTVPSAWLACSWHSL